MEYRVHDVEWTDEKISRFWDYLATFEEINNAWFSKMVGKGVLNFTDKHVKIEGNILDYGTGKGFLMQYLLEKYHSKDVKISGCDFSIEGVNVTNNKFKDNAKFSGCNHITTFPSSLPSNNFDATFLLEVIEHLTDEMMEVTMKEIHRVLKDQGIFIITTPNEEDLLMSKVHCPDCGGSFHKVQHLKSFSSESLSKHMESYGFTTVLCKGLNFHNFNTPVNRWMFFLKRIIAGVLNRTMVKPHLIYIGKKSTD